MSIALFLPHTYVCYDNVAAFTLLSKSRSSVTSRGYISLHTQEDTLFYMQEDITQHYYCIQRKYRYLILKIYQDIRYNNEILREETRRNISQNYSVCNLIAATLLIDPIHLIFPVL